MSYFAAVRDRFVADLQASLRSMQVEFKGKGGGSPEWLAALCPICGDKSGSASFGRKSGDLKCHQCGREPGKGKGGDLFEWVRVRHGHESDWDACQHLAQLFGLVFETKKKHRNVRRMSKELAEHAFLNLMQAEEAEHARSFLKERACWAPQLLERMGVGFLAGVLIFVQRHPVTGALLERYRTYTIGKGFRWAGGGRGKSPQNFWPFIGKRKEGDTILLCEGEWDVLVAYSVLQLHHKNIYAVTWTGGAHTPIKHGLVPESWSGLEVHLCYDNDVFQTVQWAEHIAPDEDKKRDMFSRRRNLIRHVAAVLEVRKCKVFFRAIPIDPIDKWGADLRDWVEAGNRNLDDLPRFTYDAIKEDRPKAEKLDFADVFNAAGQEIMFSCSVNGIDDNVAVIPKRSQLMCDMNALAACKNCRGPDLFQDRFIPWPLYEDHLIQALLSRDPQHYILKHVVCKPTACTYAEIRHTDYRTGYLWGAISENTEVFSGRELKVVSVDSPGLSGDVQVRGRAHHSNKAVSVFATDLKTVDDMGIKLEPFLAELLAACPHATTKVEEVDRHIRKRAADLSANVTQIYGREDLHIAVDLVPHSALWMTVNGSRQRAWMDVCVLGLTRTGKTRVAAKLLEHWGLGVRFAMERNWTKVGLTMGADGNKEGRLTPGLIPRNHRKLLVLDEVQAMTEEGKDPFFTHLQEARSDGVMASAKVYGQHKLPAAVRLICMGNYPDIPVEFPCQFLPPIYGRPEAIARLDYALGVPSAPTESELVACDHVWTPELSRVLILRAWALEPEDIVFEDEALRLASQFADDWRTRYASELPLYTEAEKALSLLRIGVAAANLCFSHPPDTPYQCLVRECHVEWAASWLQETFASMKYDQLSEAVIQQREVSHPFDVEYELIVKPQLKDHDYAASIMQMLFGSYSRVHLANIMGFDSDLLTGWLKIMMRTRTLRSVQRGYMVHITPTVGGQRVLENLCLLARNYPAEFAARYQRLEQWRGRASKEDPEGMLPLTRDKEELVESWEEADGHRPSNILEYPLA